MSREILKWFRPEVAEYLKWKKLSPTISNIRKTILVIKDEWEE